jgi:hypothetical protein
VRLQAEKQSNAFVTWFPKRPPYDSSCLIEIHWTHCIKSRAL